jgi:hypothetical protein
MPGPEHAPSSPERSNEHARDIERAPEVLDRKAEKAPESREEVEKNIEKARTEAQQEAISGREVSGGEDMAKGDDTPPPRVSRKESYTHTMKVVRSEMSAPARTFSKVIHNPVVERTSEVVGSTVARPNAILSGSIFAGLAVLTLYLVARHYGFALSGFETIGAFIVGWAVGIIFDLLRGMITGKRL